MTTGFSRRLVFCALALGIVVPAIPAFAQSSSIVPMRSLMAGVKFVSPTTSTELFKPTLAPRLAPGAAPFVPKAGRGGIGIGALAGIVRTRLTGEGVEDFFESSTGTMFGLWIGGNTDGVVGFTGEFNYIIRKTNIDFDGDGALDDEFSRPAFSIPAVFHINFGPEDRSKVFFYALVGPVFTFTLKQEVTVNGSGEAIDVGESFNGADIGFLGGGGVEFFRIAVEVRHNWGLRSITTEGIDETKTRAWEFLVKFRFH